MSATIAAIATPPGFGGVGVVRISGPLVRNIATAMLGLVPPPRYATLRSFSDHQNQVIDQGLALFFPAPHSFTGDDVLELHGHGGPVVLDLILRRILELGAKLARPGEFTERAYLAGKLDLSQAEAVADVISSSTKSAATAAVRTLQGALSRQIYQLKDELIQIRAYIEGALDFSDEDIDWLNISDLKARIDNLIHAHQKLLNQAHQGRLLRDGINVVIAGAPNAGKSSLLNALVGTDVAIVTPIAGTTRDVLKECIQIDGMPVHIIDTAGINNATCDVVEREGIRRAQVAIQQADQVLWVFDDKTDPHHQTLNTAQLPANVPVTLVRNKIDLTGTVPRIKTGNNEIEIAISAATGSGLDLLRQHLKASVGFNSAEGDFIAQRRHLHAIEQAVTSLQAAQRLISNSYKNSVEVIAEELCQAQNALGQITGEVTAEDVLAEIFSKFCIGK